MSAVFQFPTESIRLMTEYDLPAILELESQSYEFPWSEEVFSDCLQYGYSSWVVEIEQRVVAYCVMSLAVQECHILNLCVKPELQSQGIGRRLLVRMLELALERNADTAFLEVRPTNIHAISLYLSLGFNEIGVRKAYYPALFGREDALILAKSL